MGGGIGIPPMIGLGRAIKDTADVTVAVGYRSSDTYLYKECEELGRMIVSTDDGSLGHHGNVVDAWIADGYEPDVIFACGPKVMLRALKEKAVEKGIECYVSMEERMACGVGACLGCVCGSEEVDGHSHVKNKRVCKDGPCFDAREVVL